jgi:hypothetical protein
VVRKSVEGGDEGSDQSEIGCCGCRSSQVADVVRFRRKERVRLEVLYIAPAVCIVLRSSVSRSHMVKVHFSPRNNQSCYLLLPVIKRHEFKVQVREECVMLSKSVLARFPRRIRCTS